MTLTIEELLRIERFVRDAKERGTSSNMTLKIAEVERLISFCVETLGEEKVEEQKRAENLIQFKPELSRMRIHRSWQDDLERQKREEAAVKKAREKQRKARQESRTRLAWKNYVGSLKEPKSA